MARHKFRSYGRRIGGGLKPMLAPVLGGFADHYLNSMIPVSGVGATAVGIFLHDPITKNIGLYQVGHSLGNIIPIPGFSGTGTGGGF